MTKIFVDGNYAVVEFFHTRMKNWVCGLKYCISDIKNGNIMKVSLNLGK